MCTDVYKIIEHLKFWSIFKPFKTAYSRQIDNYLFDNLNKQFTINEVSKAVGKLYDISFTPKNNRNGSKLI